MYAHLEIKSVIPTNTTGYRVRSKIKFAYGCINIDAECIVPESASKGRLSLCMYCDTKAARLTGAELSGQDSEPEPEILELLFLRKIIPENDVVYILSLFGMPRPGNVYDRRRRVRIETPKSRKHKYYEYFELSFSRTVDEAWLLTYGALFGYGKADMK